MGLGDRLDEWADYEWVRLADLPRSGRGRARVALAGSPAVGPVAGGTGPGESSDEPLALALCSWLDEHPLWADDGRARVLLVDLDNLRADAVRWRARMAAVVALARDADHTILAGQHGAVDRARPHLAEFADDAVAVPDGSDLADHALLDGAEEVRGDDDQVVVLSNDGIFARLADPASRLTVLSPGLDALSGALAQVANRVVDLVGLEQDAMP